MKRNDSHTLDFLFFPSTLLSLSLLLLELSLLCWLIFTTCSAFRRHEFYEEYVFVQLEDRYFMIHKMVWRVGRF